MKRWANPIRRAVALGAAALAVWSVPSLAQGWSADPDDALLLELHTGSYKVGDTLRGYQTRTASASILPILFRHSTCRSGSTRSRAAQLAGCLRKISGSPSIAIQIRYKP